MKAVKKVVKIGWINQASDCSLEEMIYSKVDETYINHKQIDIYQLKCPRLFRTRRIAQVDCDFSEQPKRVRLTLEWI